MKLNRLFFRAVVLTLPFLLIGCGYCKPTNQLGDDVAVLAVPLIRGDEDGLLRSDLAKEIAHSSGYSYSSSDARYRLDVTINSDSKETIGYVWDEEPITGAFIKRLYPNESRRKVKTTVSLYDLLEKKTVIAPFIVEGFADYDFVNPTALKNIEFKDGMDEDHSVLQYSLGQLDSEEGARLESFQPLSASLATQIMEALKRAPVQR